MMQSGPGEIDENTLSDFASLYYHNRTKGRLEKSRSPSGTGMSHHFQSPRVIENVSKEKIAFSLCDEKNSKDGIFRGSHKDGSS